MPREAWSKRIAANALAVLAAAPDALDSIRRRAARHLLGATTQWLLDATPEPSPLSEEGDDNDSDGEPTNGDTQSTSSENRNPLRDEAARRKPRTSLDNDLEYYLNKALG